MSVSADKIIQLRQLLAERFGATPSPGEECYETGLPLLDQQAVPRAALTEIVSSPSAGPGGAMLLYGLLHAAIQKGERVVLIDGASAFSPKGLPQAELNRLLWTRCRGSTEAIKAADLAARDGNVPLVILLLTINAPSDLRRVPPNAWHRLQMLAEKSGVTLLVFTPEAQIGCARLRLAVGGAFPLERLHLLRTELLPALDIRVARRRVGRREDEDLRRASCA
jgi:hypothetical protein